MTGLLERGAARVGRVASDVGPLSRAGPEPDDAEVGRRFAAGEELRTEVSAKFRRERVEAELGTAGLRMTRWWTDPDGDFGVSLAVPA